MNLFICSYAVGSTMLYIMAFVDTKLTPDIV